MSAAEDKLCGLRQASRRLERYVEDFLELAELARHRSWCVLSVRAGRWDDSLRSSRVWFFFFSLIELINLVLYLNGSNFEVEETKEKFQSRHPVPSEACHVSPAHPTPGTPTYRTNGSDRLPRPKYPRIRQSSTIVLSPETPAVPQSSPPAAADARPPVAAKSSPPASPLSSPSIISLFSAQKRRMRRKRLWAHAPKADPVSAPAPEFAPVPAPAPERPPVPAPPERPHEPIPARKPVIIGVRPLWPGWGQGHGGWPTMAPETACPAMAPWVPWSAMAPRTAWSALEASPCPSPAPASRAPTT